MGLLDDAIREHLELQLPPGADAGDIARQEQEALGPVRRDPAPEELDAPTELNPLPVDEAEAEEDEEEDGFEDVAPAAPSPDPGDLGETEEWGFEDAEDSADDEEEPAEDDEDVLEQTPEFLSETPEHDRLWFEQKPPRDFDFDG